MEKVKVTNEQVVNFRTNAERYIGMNPGVFSQFIYALNKGLKNTKKAFDKYTEVYTEARFDLAVKQEKTGHIVKDGDDFAFTADGRTKLVKKNKELLDEIVEVDQYLAKDIPDDLTVSLLEVLCPFVITEEDIENKFIAWDLSKKNKDNHKQE